MKYFSLSQQWILFFLAFLILVLFYFRFHDSPLPPPSEEIYQEVVVEVAGEVTNPGIQVFREAPALRSVLEKAGGVHPTALRDTQSLSELLETGTLVTVLHGRPQETRVKLGRMEAGKLLVFSIPLDLNRVSVEDLCLVPGIGRPQAQEIRKYREKRKGFRSVEELKNVKGIGEKKWQTLSAYFTVR